MELKPLSLPGEVWKVRLPEISRSHTTGLESDSPGRAEGYKEEKLAG
jgi:hypothetical protein